MSMPCQGDMPVSIPNPPGVQPELMSDAAGDARGCCTAQPAPPDKQDGLDLTEILTNIPQPKSASPKSTTASPSTGPKNLDEGWAWLIMIAALFTHILTFGMSYATLGAFHVEFLREFGGTNAETSWTGSIMLGMMLCTGPMISVFIDKFGACAVAVVGGAFASAGFILSAMATSLLYLYFSFGVLAGLGFGMSYLPCIVMLGYFFERRRAFAAGISASGSGLGTFIFAPVNQSLIANLGWRRSFLVLGVLELILCVCGFTYLKRKIPVRRLVPEGDGEDDNGDGSEEEGLGQANSETSSPSVAIFSRPGTDETSMQSFHSLRTNIAGNTPVGSWKQSIGVKMGRSVLLQSPRNSPMPASPVLLDSFFSFRSPSAAASSNFRGSSLANNSSMGELGSRVYPPGPIPTIEVTYASSPPLKLSSPLAQSPEQGGLTIGSWQQSVIVRAGLATFLSPNTSPIADSPLALDNISRLSVPSTQMSLDVSTQGQGSSSQNYLPTTTALDSVSKEERLYPALTDLSSHGAAISATTIEAEIPDDLEEEKGSRHENPEDEDKPVVKLTKNCKKCPSTMSVIGGLFHNRFFVFFWLSGFILCIGYQLPYMYFKAFALSRGLEQDAWAVILSIMGITDMVGRLIVGSVFDRVMCISHRLMGYLASLFISSILLALMSTSSSYTTLAMTATTYTLVAGSTDPLVPALLVEYVGLDSLSYSFGLVIEMQGLGFLVGPPLAGYVYSYIQDYSSVMIVGSIAVLGSGVVLIVEPIVGRVQAWRVKNHQNNTVEEDTADMELTELTA